MKISIDSRTIKQGEFFVQFKVSNFVGLSFINDAYKNCYKGIIEDYVLYGLVSRMLEERNPIIVAVVGSIGKSTFRSYLYSILRTKYKTLESDLNTKIGFSLSVINGLTNHKIIVAEIGIDRIGDMEDIASLVKPSISVITKLGMEHLEFFKSYKNVILEESKIRDFTTLNKVYINSLDINDFKKYTHPNSNFIKYNSVSESKLVSLKINSLVIPPHEKEYLFGIYLICMKYFKFSDNEFIDALSKLKKPKGRYNIIKISDNSLVIDDTYNAVCDQAIIEGVKFSIQLANQMNKKLIVVIPNMVENGVSANNQHNNIAKYLNSSGIENAYIVGDNLKYYKKYLKIKYESADFADKLKIKQERNTIYYIKATRRYHGPELVEKIKHGYIK